MTAHVVCLSQFLLSYKSPLPFWFLSVYVLWPIEFTYGCHNRCWHSQYQFLRGENIQISQYWQILLKTRSYLFIYLFLFELFILNQKAWKEEYKKMKSDLMYCVITEKFIFFSEFFGEWFWYLDCPISQ